MDLNALLADPELLKRLLEPSAEDRAAARNQALMMAGFGMIGGQPRDIGRSAMAGIVGYNQNMDRARSAAEDRLRLQMALAQYGQQQQERQQAQTYTEALKSVYSPGFQSEDREGGSVQWPAVTDYSKAIQAAYTPQQVEELRGKQQAYQRQQDVQRLLGSPTFNQLSRQQQIDTLSKMGYGDVAKEWDALSEKMSTTPHTLVRDGAPTPVVLGERGTVSPLSGYAPLPKINMVNRGGLGTEAVDENTVRPGTMFTQTPTYAELGANANRPFGVSPGGEVTPNVGYQQYELGKSRAGAPRMTVNQYQESEQAKVVGKGYGELFMEMQKGALAANSRIAKLDRMEQLLTGIDTGKLTPLATDVQALADSFGLKVGTGLAPKQAALSLVSEMALQARNPSGGAGMPGAMSDADRQFLVNMQPGLAQTPEGRRLIIDTHRKLAQREQQVAAKAREYRAKNRGSLDDAFFEQLQVWSEQNPLFPAPAAQQSRSADGIVVRRIR